MPSHFADEPEHIGLLRETMRRFVDEEMKPEQVREWDREHRFPRELFRKLADLGVCGLTIDEEFGGQGRDLVAAVAVIEELCRGGSFAAGPFIHCAFYGGMNVSENGSPEQKAELLPKLANGDLLFAYGLSEPDVGGDLASVRTTAQRSDDGSAVILNGSKRWCTGAEFADFIYCLVRSDDSSNRYRNLTLVLVPTDLPGITIAPIDHMNLRYTLSSDVMFDDVHVPIDRVVGGEAGWNRGWNMLAGPALDVEKIEITAVTFGIAQAAVEEAWQYAQERQQFGKPISGHQAVRHALVEARTKLEACRHMLYHGAWLAQEGRPCSVETSMAKLFVADTAVEVVLACQRVMGAYGLSEGYDMERHVRDILGMPIVGGSSNMQKNNIANRLGLADG
ncbi:MAG: acyl-CoA dehydrogenase family protein [Myxococcota bacterium]|jgi:alkylation response protein AidB-like acyl-CoA dehydrogenase|nr:acyl-CoA dehydrogenase family protein [Myxococcota bacterium]